jgi:4-methyl-5(b-hydroxyethyl)-thiazole monophosphate biosynthesis
MAKKVFLFLADGFEEVEAVTPLDYLRRAGADLVTVSISGKKEVCGAHNVVIRADALIGEIDAPSGSGIVLPGGMPGSANLAASPELDAIIRRFDAEKKYIAAICAAPVFVLGVKGILDGRRYTCYPGAEAELCRGCAEWCAEPVVVSEHIITSRGPGTAGIFAEKIIEVLFDKETAKKITDAVLLHQCCAQ